MLSGPMLLPASSTWEVITGPRCKVCIMKLSHFRGFTPVCNEKRRVGDEMNSVWCFAIREKVGGRDQDRTGDPLLANPR
jgi:hypothetical protein